MFFVLKLSGTCSINRELTRAQEGGNNTHTLTCTQEDNNIHTLTHTQAITYINMYTGRRQKDTHTLIHRKEVIKIMDIAHMCKKRLGVNVEKLRKDHTRFHFIGKVTQMHLFLWPKKYSYILYNFCIPCVPALDATS